MRKIFFCFLLLFFVSACFSKDSNNFKYIGKWKFEKTLRVDGGLSKGKDVDSIFGKCFFEINDNNFSMCGEKTSGVTYKIVRASTRERDPRFNHFSDSYQYGFGKDRKEIIFLDVMAKAEAVVELEFFENRLIYYWDGFLIYFKKE